MWGAKVLGVAVVYKLMKCFFFETLVIPSILCVCGLFPHLLCGGYTSFCISEGSPSDFLPFLQVSAFDFGSWRLFLHYKVRLSAISASSLGLSSATLTVLFLELKQYLKGDTDITHSNGLNCLSLYLFFQTSPTSPMPSSLSQQCSLKVPTCQV